MAWYWRVPFRQAQVELDSSAFDKDYVEKYEGMLEGRQCSPEDFPDELQVLTKHRTLPCFLRVTASVLVVCQGFRDAVEALEPGVHRFFPVTLRMRSGEPAARHYSFLNIRQQFDAILLRHSDWDWQWNAGRKMFPKDQKNFLPRMGTRLGLSRPAIAGRHLWHSVRMAPFFSFISDAVYERINVKGCRPLGLDIHHCEEYDEPWVESENVDRDDEGPWGI